MITLTLVGDNEVLARLRSMTPRIHIALRRAIEKEATFETGYVKGEKLSGQVLNVRTGTLRRSINYVIRDDAHAILASVGTNVVYGAIHEYGGQQHRVSTLGKAYTANFPPRSFLRSSLRDNRDRILNAIRTAVETAVYA